MSFRSFTQLFRLWGIIGALLAVLVGVPGCSTLKLAYSNAPNLSYWWLDRYLDFDDAQTLKVRADLAAVQDWHRTHELPAYVDTLQNLQSLARAEVTPAQVCQMYAEIKSHFQRLVEQTGPTIASVAPTLQARQLGHLSRQLDKRRERWREEWLDGSPSEHQARLLKQWVERTQKLYGKLQAPQLTRLKAGVASSAFDANQTMRESQRRNQDILQSLRNLQRGDLSVSQAQAQTRALLMRTMNPPDPDYRDYREKMTQENCRVFADLHNSTTPAQRLQLVEVFKGYEVDARLLMAQGNSER